MYVMPPREESREAVLEALTAECCRLDGPHLGCDRHEGVCHCAQALADGAGVYLCPEVWARCSGTPLERKSDGQSDGESDGRLVLAAAASGNTSNGK